MVSTTSEEVLPDSCRELAEKNSDAGPVGGGVAATVSGASLQPLGGDASELFTSSFAQAKPFRGVLPAWNSDTALHRNNEQHGWELLTIRRGTTHVVSAKLVDEDTG